jgi:hypothetical protein
MIKDLAKGQTIRFSQDIDYAKAGELYIIEAITKMDLHIGRVGSESNIPGLKGRTGTMIRWSRLKNAIIRGQVAIEIVA